MIYTPAVHCPLCKVTPFAGQGLFRETMLPSNAMPRKGHSLQEIILYDYFEVVIWYQYVNFSQIKEQPIRVHVMPTGP